MSGDSRWKPPSLTWTLPQRRALLVLLLALLAFLVVRYALNPVYVSDPQPERPARADELADRIDPNTANWTDLAALPGIGEKRARDIVAYREETKRYSRVGLVFARKEDLLRIKGIGPAMVEALEPYLVFPTGPIPMPSTTGPATAPSG